MKRSPRSLSLDIAPTGMPILSAGRHRNPRQGACFMEFASYLAGERWSDHPACTHPVLAALARDVNDLTGDEARNGLSGHIHRVVGLNGADSAESRELAAVIAVRAATAALPVVSLERQRALAAGILNVLAKVDRPGLAAQAAEAFAQAPDAERWARRYLAAPSVPREFTNHAATAMVHTAVVGIALACVSDTDARLSTLLASVIDDAEARLLHTAARENIDVPATAGETRVRAVVSAQL